MNLNEVIFLNDYPTLDLHGFDRDYARVKVNEFINDNIIMKNEIIVIVHGIGNGILRNEVHSLLSKNKLVIDYKLFYNNIGATVVKINIATKLDKNSK